MGHKYRERVKTAIIGMLIATSLIQVGILWGYQSQGTPINFISTLFQGSAQTGDEAARNSLFKPFKLILSDGEQSHWLIDNSNEFYKPLWTEAVTYLKDIADGKLEQVRTTASWDDLATRRGFTIEFKAAIRPDLLRWFLGITEKQDIPTVWKMKVVPDILDEASNRIFIYDNSGKVYEYDINNYVREKSFNDMLATVSSKNNTSLYRTYCSVEDARLNANNPDINGDILFVLGQPQYWPYFDIQSSVPVKAASENELAAILLGSEKDRYKLNVYSDKTIQFIGDGNLYKIYSNGLMTYDYLGTDSSGKGSIGDALTNAYEFIDKAEKLSNMNADIYLSSVNYSLPGVYEMTFDYEINGMPIYTDIAGSGTDEEMADAITIDVSSGRVLKCSWLLRDFSYFSRSNYDDRFNDLIQTSSLMYQDMKIKDMNMGYVIKNKDSGILEPNLIIEEKNGLGILAIPMEKGE